jgi:hypothetical protein
VNFLLGHFSDRELSAGDLVREDVHALLAGDAKLQAVFDADRIFTSPLMPSDVANTLPDLWVTNLVTHLEDRPGWIHGEITTHILVRFSWPRHEPLMRGGPGLDTLRSYIWHSVIQNRILEREVNGVRIPYTAKPLVPGDTGYGESSLDPDKLLYRLHIEAVAEVRLNAVTGKPLALANAGW